MLLTTATNSWEFSFAVREQHRFHRGKKHEFYFCIWDGRRHLTFKKIGREEWRETGRRVKLSLLLQVFRALEIQTHGIFNCHFRWVPTELPGPLQIEIININAVDIYVWHLRGGWVWLLFSAWEGIWPDDPLSISCNGFFPASSCSNIFSLLCLLEESLHWSLFLRCWVLLSQREH